jgi:hypothetical protein
VLRCSNCLIKPKLSNKRASRATAKYIGLCGEHARLGYFVTGINPEIILGYRPGLCKLILGTRVPSNEIDELPLPRCVGVHQSHGLKGDRTEIRLDDPDFEALFIWLAQDVANRLRGLQGDELSKELTRVFHEWVEAFRLRPEDGLSRIAQQGLFAELFFLQTVLIPRESVNAVTAWKSQHAVHDFQIGDYAWEVKSNAGRRPEVTITSEQQLDPAGLSDLRLVVLELRVSEEAGTAVSELIKALNKELEHDLSLIKYFHTALAKYGYLSDRSIKKQYFFTPRRLSEYLVTESFPSITRRDLPLAVHSVSYRLSLGSLDIHLAGPAVIF